MPKGSDDRVKKVAELDAELRKLEADGERDSDRFGELSAQREALLNEHDDAD